MASARRSCRNKPDVFWYICGEYTITLNRKPVTSFITRAYHAYFGIKLVDQDKALASHMVCKACTETLWKLTNDKKSLNFGIPMVWNEPTNHVPNCYFCAVDVTGISRKNPDSLKYPDLQSVRRPVAHCEEIPVPIFGEIPDISDEDVSIVEGHADEEVVLEDDTPHPFSPKELNDLVNGLRLSTDSVDLLASRLKEKKLLSDRACISFFRNKHQEYLYFSSTVKDLVYCADIAQLLPQYEPKHWRLFIDSSKRSLKCILLQSTTLKEKYDAVKYAL